jgi:acyl carrier protein
MTDPKLFAELSELVRTVAKIDPEIVLNPESNLVEDLGVDSLDLVGVYLQIQDHYNVVVSEDDMPTLVSLGDLTQYVADRLPSAAA